MDLILVYDQRWINLASEEIQDVLGRSDRHPGRGALGEPRDVGAEDELVEPTNG
jgi:hypothetical protein